MQAILLQAPGPLCNLWHHPDFVWSQLVQNCLQHRFIVDHSSPSWVSARTLQAVILGHTVAHSVACLAGNLPSLLFTFVPFTFLHPHSTSNHSQNMCRWRRPKPGPSLPCVAAMLAIWRRSSLDLACDTLWTKHDKAVAYQGTANSGRVLQAAIPLLKSSSKVTCWFQRRILKVQSLQSITKPKWTYTQTPCVAHTLLDLGISTK